MLNSNFSLNDQNIKIIKSYTHMGVTLSTDVKWNRHIDTIITSAKKNYLNFCVNFNTDCFEII